MLFDLSSPGRKNVVRVVFGFLALIFAVGFVGFGIGGELGGGGIIDSITGNGSGSTDDAFEQQIEDAEEAIEADPADSDALSDLALFRVQSGTAQLERDEATNAPVGLTEDARAEFEEAIVAWESYVETDQPKVDVATASAVVSAYFFLGDATGAAEAQTLLAESSPSAPNYGSLADLYYRDLEIEKGDRARDQALEEGNKELDKVIEAQLAQVRKQALAAEKQQEKQGQGTDAAPTGEGTALEDPFGGGIEPVDPGAVPVP